jgi:hypothetical protein
LSLKKQGEYEVNEGYSKQQLGVPGIKKHRDRFKKVC